MFCFINFDCLAAENLWEVKKKSKLWVLDFSVFITFDPQSRNPCCLTWRLPNQNQSAFVLYSDVHFFLRSTKQWFSRLVLHSMIFLLLSVYLLLLLGNQTGRLYTGLIVATILRFRFWNLGSIQVFWDFRIIVQTASIYIYLQKQKKLPFSSPLIL
jgi:hypothetical protein